MPPSESSTADDWTCSSEPRSDIGLPNVSEPVVAGDTVPTAPIRCARMITF